MSAPVRYQFDQVFALEDATRPEPPKVDIVTAQSQAETARAEGFRAGREAAATDSATRLAAAVEKLGALLPGLEASLAGHTARMQGAAAQIGYMLARKLARRLIDREPEEEIVTLLSAALGELQQAPHLVVRVNEALADSLSEQIRPLAEARGFQGRLIVMGEPDVAPGDVRVEWADGGIVRCQADIEDALQEIVDRFAAARREGIEEAAE